MENPTGTCDECFKGGEKSNNKIDDFAGVKAFIARPQEKTKKAVVIATDVFGHVALGAQRLADAMANAGFLCIVPDLFEGDILEEKDLADVPKRTAWMEKHPQISKVPIVEKVIHELRTKEGIERVGVAGYCFGGKIAFVLAATDHVDAFISAHPSTPNFPDDIEAIKKPGLWVCAEIDRTFGEENRKKLKKY